MVFSELVMLMNSCGISVLQNTPCVGRQWGPGEDSEGDTVHCSEGVKTPSCLRGGCGACVQTGQTPAPQLIPRFPGKRLAVLVGEAGRVLIPEQ